MRSLITGITGFVGSHLAEFLLTKNEKVSGIKRWRSPLDNIKGILKDIQLFDCDLLDLDSLQSVMKKIKPDRIYHLAAQSYVPYSFLVPVETLKVNVLGTMNLYDAVRNAKIDPLIHYCSSSEVYGQVETKDVPIKETQAFKPVSPYAVSKAAADLLSYACFINYNMKIIRTRAFTHTGPRRGEVFVVAAFAKQIIQIKNGLIEPIIRVGNLDSVRTFMDVRDITKAYWLVLKFGKPGEVYNIGGVESMKVGEMLDRLLKIADLEKKVTIIVDPALLRPSDVTLQIPDCTKFRTLTGWTPKIPLEKTLIDILVYWQDKL